MFSNGAREDKRHHLVFLSRLHEVTHTWTVCWTVIRIILCILIPVRMRKWTPRRQNGGILYLMVTPTDPQGGPGGRAWNEGCPSILYLCSLTQLEVSSSRLCLSLHTGRVNGLVQREEVNEEEKKGGRGGRGQRVSGCRKRTWRQMRKLKEAVQREGRRCKMILFFK